jgi:hypothetical protein
MDWRQMRGWPQLVAMIPLSIASKAEAGTKIKILMKQQLINTNEMFKLEYFMKWERKQNMAQDINWTPHMDAQLHAMRARLLPVTVCATKLGISRNAIINRLDRLGLATGARFRRQQQVKQASRQPSRPALTVIDNRNFGPSLPPLPRIKSRGFAPAEAGGVVARGSALGLDPMGQALLSRRDTWILCLPQPSSRRTVWLPPHPRIKSEGVVARGSALGLDPMGQALPQPDSPTLWPASGRKPGPEGPGKTWFWPQRQGPFLWNKYPGGEQAKPARGRSPFLKKVAAKPRPF